MKTRIVHTKVWKDQWFVKLSKGAKFLWLYLLTNDKINISGVFELSDREILFDTSIDSSILSSIQEELKPKAVFKDGWVKVCNVEKYNKYLNSPLNVTSCLKEVSYIPEVLKKDFNILLDTSIDTPINKESGIINSKFKIIKQDQETEEEKRDRIRVAKEALYNKMGWKI